MFIFFQHLCVIKQVAARDGQDVDVSCYRNFEPGTSDFSSRLSRELDPTGA